MNAFQRLVDDLNSGELTILHIDLAVKSWIEHRTDIPDGIKDLLVRNGDQGQGIIRHLFKQIKETIGAMELAYRRGRLDPDSSLKSKP